HRRALPSFPTRRTSDLQEPRLAGLFERLLEAFVDLEDLAVDVVVADADPQRIRPDDHAFDHRMRVVTQDVAILESAGLALVGVRSEEHTSELQSRENLV